VAAADAETLAFYNREAPVHAGYAEMTVEHRWLQKFAVPEGSDGSISGILHICARRGV